MPEPKRVSVTELRRRMEGGEKSLILDVRTEDEYRTLHARGAVLLPHGNVSVEAVERCRAAAGAGDDARLYFICRSGRRATEACEQLLHRYPDAEVVEGGTLAWAQAGLAVIGGNEP